MTNHTPGPWKYNVDSTNRIMTTDNSVVAATYGGFLGHIEQAANTRLIAAAPEMYEYVVRRASAGDLDAQALTKLINVSDGGESTE